MTSKLIQVRLPDLGRKPHGCPEEALRSWARLQATHKSVKGLFDTLNQLRQQGDPRGAISESQRDLARAAIAFTSAGVDASLRTLLRDTLPTLLAVDGAAHNAFVGHFYDKRLQSAPTQATKQAIVALDPRAALIELYVADLTAASIQGAKDLIAVRKALGVRGEQVSDQVLKDQQPFFNARQEVVHELDLVDPSGKGTRSRRHRDIEAVGAQCGQVLLLVSEFVTLTATAVKSAALTAARSVDGVPVRNAS
ncbi:hypothetical protein [Actinomadura sp. NTSP31]|uniref:hypothetical protein n=1 Tax=Actinomadura sp. NTSP31 TaxID=1735447 RepID=UPI0035BF90F3